MKVHEIFTSIQGEGLRAGLPCTFVRFTACDLRCTYCDTEYAFSGGRRWEMSALFSEIASRHVPLVCVTGGEPMLQRDIVPFLEGLLERGHTALLETGGHRPLRAVPEAVVRIVDVKTPGAFSAAADADFARSPAFLNAHFCYDNLACLQPHDEVKFVITSRADFDWALAFSQEHALFERVAQVHVSPSWHDVQPASLAAWLLASRAPLRLNLQLHKYVWGPDVSGV